MCYKVLQSHKCNILILCHSVLQSHKCAMILCHNVFQSHKCDIILVHNVLQSHKSDMITLYNDLTPQWISMAIILDWYSQEFTRLSYFTILAQSNSKHATTSQYLSPFRAHVTSTYFTPYESTPPFTLSNWEKNSQNLENMILSQGITNIDDNANAKSNINIC